MAGNLKGLTIELGGDTTKLGKALEDVDKKSRNLSSELGQVNKLLKLDPGNADLLAQKQEILTEAIANTSKKLDTLKEAERQVQEQFRRGEASEEQVRALQREIIATTQKLGQYESAARETAQALDKLGDEGEDGIKDTGDAAEDAAKDLRDMADAADEVEDGLDTAGVAAGTFLGNLATNALSSTVDFLKGCAEAAMEYRTEMGKLDVAFENSGFTAETAHNAYQELVGIMGETDTAVEAANHLAKLTDNEQDLASWTGDILPGVFATFGDSLPLEGLTEAANETAKVGQVTGPLADAINWATAEADDWNKALSGNAKAQKAFQDATKEGASAEDAFNAALGACSTEQERQSLITQSLSSIYGDASSAYKETNADIIAANKANDALTASMAAAGTAVMPLITAVKEIATALLNAAVPALNALMDNLPIVGVVAGGVAASIIAFKVAALAATAATEGMTLAQKAAAAAQAALNVVMSANPIGLVILAITALVAAFMALWKNSEAFREFWKKLWEGIKTVALGVADAFKALPGKIYNAIKGAVTKVKQWGEDLVKTAKTKATEMKDKVVSTLKELPGKIWTAIKDAVVKVAKWGLDMQNKAKTAALNLVTGVINALKALPGKIWSAIKGAITNVTKWGSDMVSKAKSAMGKVVSGVVSTLSQLPKKVLSIGANLVTGLWNGINNKLQWLKNKIAGFTKSVLNGIKSFFGVHSPSTETAWIGEMLDQGLAKGVLDNVNAPIKAMRSVSSDVLGAATGDLDGLAVERSLQRSASPVAASAAIGGDLGVKLDKILTAIERGQILTIDGDALVGATAAKMDSKLGQRRALAARGAV